VFAGIGDFRFNIYQNEIAAEILLKFYEAVYRDYSRMGERRVSEEGVNSK